MTSATVSVSRIFPPTKWLEFTEKVLSEQQRSGRKRLVAVEHVKHVPSRLSNLVLLVPNKVTSECVLNVQKVSDIRRNLPEAHQN